MVEHFNWNTVIAEPRNIDSPMKFVSINDENGGENLLQKNVKRMKHRPTRGYHIQHIFNFRKKVDDDETVFLSKLRAFCFNLKEETFSIQFDIFNLRWPKMAKK